MPEGLSEFALQPGLCPVHLAAWAGSAGALGALLDAGASATRQASPLAFAGLHCASVFGPPDRLDLLLARLPREKVEDLSGVHGSTPLQIAAVNGPASVGRLRALMRWGADPRAGMGAVAPRDAALLCLCMKDDSDPEAVALLLEARCCPNATMDPPWPRWKAVYAAMRLAARLTEASGRQPGTLLAALSFVVGSTALHLAATTGDLAVVRLLLQAQAEPSKRNLMGQTPLESAAQRTRLGGVPGPLAALFAAPHPLVGLEVDAGRPAGAEQKGAEQGPGQPPLGEGLLFHSSFLRVVV